MKIAHIFWALGFGGIETMLVNIANAQAQYGAEVHIILINEMYEKSLLERLSPRVKLHLLNRKVGSKGLGFIWKLNKELKSINPDKIHIHGPEFYAMIFNRRLSHEASLTLHDLPVEPARHGFTLLRSWVARCTFGHLCHEDLVRLIPKIFSISEAVKEAFHWKYGIDSQVVFNGILTSNFKQRDSKQKADPFRVVQISRLDYMKKGQDLLIEAAALIKGNVDVTFIGDGEGMEYLKKHTGELEMNDYVHFLGKQTQDFISKHLKDYDLFVQPSRREGFGLTVAEAMAARVPVLVSSGQGPAEVTENDKFGWVFENGNVQDLADKMIHIRDNYDAALEKANLACEHVKQHYDVSVTARRYMELY